MSFAEPRLLWLIVLTPAVAALAAVLWRRRLQATAAWVGRGLWGHLLAAYSPRRLAFSVTWLGLALLGITLALARPRWGLAEQEVERRGVDVVFVLDSSLSMAALDVPPSRLFAAKTLIRRLIRETPQNRVALVQAEGIGEVLSPLSVDGTVIDLLLDTVEPGSLLTPGTALAPALEAALDLFLEEETRHRVAVVLSDGEDHGGGLDTIGARLAEAGVVTHTLGLGTPSGAPVPIPGARRGEVKRDDQGQVVISRLGEQNLEALARATGAIYLRAGSPGVDLTPLVSHLEQHAAGSLGRQTVEAPQERFQWPLALAALALAAQLGVGPFRPARRRLPAAREVGR